MGRGGACLRGAFGAYLWGAFRPRFSITGHTQTAAHRVRMTAHRMRMTAHTLVDIRTQPRLKPTDMCPPPPARQGVRDAIDEIWAAMSALVGVKKRAAYESRRNGKKAGEARVLVGPREFDKWLSEGKSCTWLPGSSLPVTCRSERKSCEWLVEVSHTNGTRWIRS